MSLCLCLKRVGVKIRKTTKLHRKDTYLCWSQRYSVFRSLFRSFGGNYETAGQAFRSFFVVWNSNYETGVKLRNEHGLSVSYVTKRRALEALRYCSITTVSCVTESVSVSLS